MTRLLPVPGTYNYFKTVTAYHKARADQVIEWVASNREHHHVIILPGLNVFKIRDYVIEQAAAKGIEQCVEFNSAGVPKEARLRGLGDLENWMRRPEDHGYTLIGSNLAYHGWRIGGDPQTSIRLSWVTQLSAGRERDAQIMQAIGRFFCVHTDMTNVGTGLIPSLTIEEFLK
ncbi:MAG: hypothetical protein ACN6OP_22935 [Pseudomonadales bacterium]